MKVNCPHDSECVVGPGVPVGGFDDALEVLDKAIDCLVLEVEFESPDYEGETP